MDASASFVLLQMAAEESEDKNLSYEELKKFAEDTMMANGPRENEKAEEDGKEKVDVEAEGSMDVEGKEEDGGVEVKMETVGPIAVEGKEVKEVDMKTEGPMEAEDGDEDEEQGGVTLANDL